MVILELQQPMETFPYGEAIFSQAHFILFKYLLMTSSIFPTVAGLRALKLEATRLREDYFRSKCSCKISFMDDASREVVFFEVFCHIKMLTF